MSKKHDNYLIDQVTQQGIPEMTNQNEDKSS